MDGSIDMELVRPKVGDGYDWWGSLSERERMRERDGEREDGPRTGLSG